MHTKALRNLSLLFLLVLLLAIPSASLAAGRGHFRSGRVHAAIVPGFGFWSYPYWGWGDPFWNWGPYYYPVETRGTIKLKDFNKHDEVYINGAYAGRVDKLKSIKLEPGQYQVQVRHQGKDLVDRNVYVVSGKTIEIFAQD